MRLTEDALVSALDRSACHDFVAHMTVPGLVLWLVSPDALDGDQRLGE